jgi:anaerobic magnesium-protoporphyrin IX monomethyl ester cyclase
MSLDVLLVNPLFLHEDPVEQRLMTPYFPLGILYLAAALRDAGFTVDVYDAMFRPGPEDFRAFLAESRPSIVGLGVLSTVRHSALRLAVIAKEQGCTVIAGGPDPTARPEGYLLANGDEGAIGDGAAAIDVVVIGEGEESAVELVASLLGRSDKSLDEIGGLALCRDQKVIRTEPRPLYSDIDAIPFPARDLLDMDAYRQAWRGKHGFWALSVIATRGCPYECSWCQKGVFGRSYRPRSPESVAEEIRHIKERYAPDRLRLIDDVIGIGSRDAATSWVRRWRDEMLARDAVVPFECLSRVDLVHREMLTWLQEAGCVRIAFGAESGSQKVLDAMHKGTTVEQIRTAAALCQELGIEAYFYIMVGYPGEEWADIVQTIRLLRETLPDEFSTTVAYPLPGTPFYEQVKEQLVATPNWDYTSENRPLYRQRYGQAFYGWLRRLLYQEWRFARLRRGIDRGGARVWASVLLKLALSRAMVQAHRLIR